jgi:outer membrane autotransporter protein
MCAAKISSVAKKSAILSRARHRLNGSVSRLVLLRVLPAIVIGLPMISTAQAQAVNVWDGSAGNWATSGSWSNGAPQSTDDPTLVQSGSVTVNSSVTGGRVQVLGGGSVTIDAGGTLNTSGSGFLSTIGIAPSLVDADGNADLPGTSTPGPAVTTSATSGTGSMTITGAGATWNTGSVGLRVGNEATGTLAVSSGGALDMTGGLLSVGLNAGGNGTLNIDAGTVSNTGGALRLGYDGATGTVTISDGGTLTTTMLNSVGDSDNGSASTGTVNISGAGSSWTINNAASGDLNVGWGTGASGTIDVSAGGTLSSAGNAFVGYLGGTGSVTITGAGSSWSLTTAVDGLTLGDGTGSNGTVLISGGATLNTVGPTIIGYNDGTNGGGTGKLTIDGAGTVWNVTGEGIQVGAAVSAAGSAANGTLIVSNGAAVNAATVGIAVGNNPGSTGTFDILSGGTVQALYAQIGAGTATIDGTGSQLNLGGRLEVYGGGEIDITNGGTLTTGQLSTIGIAPGSLPTGLATNLTGGTGSMSISGTGSSWQAGSAGERVGNGATGTLTVASGGALNMTGGLLSVGLNAGGTGTLDIDNGTVTNTGGALRLGYNGGSGTLSITDGGSLTTTLANSIGNSDAGGPAGGTGAATVSGSGSVWTITGANGALVVGNGANSKGALTITDGGTLTDSGVFNLGQQAGAVGTVTVSAGGILNTSGTTTIGEDDGTGNGGGTGTLTIDGKGSVWNAGGTNVGIDIGGGVTSLSDSSGTNGILVVSNGGSVNAAGNGIFIGTTSGSAGTLNILSGGTVNTGLEVAIGNGAGTGTATIDGSGSQLTSGQNIVVGFGTSTGTLSITNGGAASAVSQVLIGQGGNGTVTVDGQGSSLTGKSGVLVGFDGGTAVLNLTNGGAVTASTLAVGSGTQTAAGTGTLNVGTGGVAGTVNGGITMGGTSSTINFDQNQSNYVFSSAISDDPNGAPTSGSVNFTGTGNTTLTADSTYTSPTNVNAGTLTIAAGGSIADSSLTTVASGATLAGAGSVGNVTIAGGATIAPTGTGTLTTGAITFASGSTYQVSINPNGQSSNIAATSATLQGGTVQLHAGSGNFASGTTYNLVTTTGGVTGQFAGLSDSDLIFLNASLGYTTDDVTLSLARNNVTFASVGFTPNEKAVGGALDQLGSGSQLVAAVEGQNAIGARAAFNSLSGEVYASSHAAMIEDAELIGDTVGRRLSQPFDGSQSAFGTLEAVNFAPDGAVSNQPLAYVDDADANPASGAIVRKPGLAAPLPPALFYSSWVQGFGDWTDFNSNGNAAAMQTTTGGVLAGVDATYLGTYRIGFAGGYSGTGLSDGRASSASIDSYHIALYGGAQEGPVGVQIGGAYNWHNIDATRSVAFPGFMDTVKSDSSADTAQVFGEANYRERIGNSVIEPFAGFDYINLKTFGFNETGGPAALNVSGASQGVFFSTIGSRVSSEIAEISGVQVIGRGTVAWRHAAFDTNTSIFESFPGGTSFDVSGTPISRDAAVTEVGFDGNISPYMSIGLSWSGQFAYNAHENSLHGQFLYRW